MMVERGFFLLTGGPQFWSQQNIGRRICGQRMLLGRYSDYSRVMLLASRLLTSQQHETDIRFCFKNTNKSISLLLVRLRSHSTRRNCFLRAADSEVPLEEDADRFWTLAYCVLGVWGIGKLDQTVGGKCGSFFIGFNETKIKCNCE